MSAWLADILNSVRREKGMTQDEVAGWHYWLNGRESEWTLGAGDGQGGLACCDSWGRKESDTTERLSWTEWSCISRANLGYLFFRPTIIWNVVIYFIPQVLLITCWIYTCSISLGIESPPSLGQSALLICPLTKFSKVSKHDGVTS